MNIYTAVIVLVVCSWVLVLACIGWVDRTVKTRYRASREVRDWQNKVEAMRRMADLEGQP